MTQPQDFPASSRGRFYEFGAFRVDSVERLLLRDGVTIPLTSKSFDVLLLLVRNGGQTVLKERFMDEVWRGTVVEESNLTDNISTLRQILGDDARDPRYIQTVPRRGYRFVSDVRQTETPAVLVHERLTAHVVIDEGLPDTEPKRSLGLAAVSGAGVIAIAVAALFLTRDDPKRIAQVSTTAPLRMSVQPVTTDPRHEFSPVLSPDGRMVAYCAKPDPLHINVFVKQTDVGEPLRLTSGEGRDGSPTWSPDGRFIAFVHWDLNPELAGIYRIPALGGPARHILKSASVGDLAWSPDGRTIAFTQKEASDGPFGIVLLDLSTLDVRTLTHPPPDSVGDAWLTFSPDSRRLAFARMSTIGAGDLYVTPVAENAPQRITFDDRYIVGVAWDPRQDVLIFSSNRDDRQSLWKVAAKGGTPIPLEPGVDDALDPAIDRAGQRLVYTKLTKDSNVFRLELGSASASPVPLIASTKRDHLPRVSPDRRQIAFESDRSGFDEVWVTAIDGSSARQITAAGQATATQPAWSPDGREIAYLTRIAGASVIQIASVADGRRRSLTRGFNCEAPSWSRDGRFIYFSANRGSDWQVWKIPSAGGTAVQVTRSGGFESAESVDGRYLYYNKHGYGQFGLFRQAVAGGAVETVVPIMQCDSLGDWELTRDGVFFLHRYEVPSRKAAKQTSIRFFNFSTRQMREIAPFPDPGGDPGLNVSDDGKSVIYSSISLKHDIMLVTNYR